MDTDHRFVTKEVQQGVILPWIHPASIWLGKYVQGCSPGEDPWMILYHLQDLLTF